MITRVISYNTMIFSKQSLITQNLLQHIPVWWAIANIKSIIMRTQRSDFELRNDILYLIHPYVLWDVSKECFKDNWPSHSKISLYIFIQVLFAYHLLHNILWLNMRALWLWFSLALLVSLIALVFWNTDPKSDGITWQYGPFMWMVRLTLGTPVAAFT